MESSLAGLSTTGLLKQETDDALHGWIDVCISAGLVTISKNQYRTLHLTPAGRDVMRDRHGDVTIPRPRLLVAQAVRRVLDDDEDRAFQLYRLRRAWRQR